MTSTPTTPPAFLQLVAPDQYSVGEGLNTDGTLSLILGFRVDGDWIGWNLTPKAAVDVANALAAWLDDHVDAARATRRRQPMDRPRGRGGITGLSGHRTARGRRYPRVCAGPGIARCWP